MKRQWVIDSREKKGLSQEKLAKMCNVTQMTISNVESGRRRPSPELAKKLAKILKIKWTKFYDEPIKE